MGREGASESPQVALSPSEGSQDNSRGIRRLLWTPTAITTKETLCAVLLPAARCWLQWDLYSLCCALLCAAACCRKHQKPHTPGARVDGRPVARTPVHREQLTAARTAEQMHNSCAAEHTEHKAHSEQLRSK